MTEWEERNEDRSLRGETTNMTADFPTVDGLGGFARARVFSLSFLFMFLLFSICETRTLGDIFLPLSPKLSSPSGALSVFPFRFRKLLSCLSDVNIHGEKGKRGETLRSVLNRAFALVLISIVYVVFCFYFFFILVRLAGSFSDLTCPPREFLLSLVYARMEYS